MMIILLILTFAVIVALQAPQLVRKKLWGELAAFSVLLAIGFVFAFLRMLRII